MRLRYVVSHPCTHAERCVVLCTPDRDAAEHKADQYDGGRVDVEHWN